MNLVWWQGGLVFLLLGIALSDASRRRVANQWPTALLALALCRWSQFGVSGVVDCALGLLGAGLPLLLLYAAGGVGAADVKVFASLGASVGLQNLATLYVFSLLATGLLSLLYLVAWDKSLLASIVRLSSPRYALSVGRKRRQTLPLTVAFCVGALRSAQGSAPWFL